MQMSGALPAQAAVLRARSVVGTGRYLVGAGGRDPRARLPASTVRGRRGCDDAGFLAWCLGYDRYQPGFALGWDWISADSMIVEAETRGAWFRLLPEPEIGAVVAYCSIELERNGHRDRVGHAGLVVALPASWTTDDRGWAALRIIHCARSIQRRRGYAIDETRAIGWAHRGSYRGASHPYWRARFLRYVQAER
jgi:hypothetical protein